MQAGNFTLKGKINNDADCWVPTLRCLQLQTLQFSLASI